MSSLLIDVVHQNQPGRLVRVEYTNKRGARGSYTLILADYGNAVRRDLSVARRFTASDLAEITPEGIDPETMEEARAAIQKAFEDSIQRGVEGMPRKGDFTVALKDSDGEVVSGMKAHKDDPTRVYVSGICVGYTMIEPGEPKKEVNSRPLTIAKDAIRRRFTTDKWRFFKGAEIVTLAADGERYEAVTEAEAEAAAI